MSRIGKQPVEIPDGVEVDIGDGELTVSGPQGELTREIDDALELSLSDDELVIDRPDDTREARSIQGLTRSLIDSMVRGVHEGFSKKLEINGVGYRAEQAGDFLRFDLGFSHPVLFEIPEKVSVELPSQTDITLSSPDKELLGQVAAKMRDLRPPEPYKGKGIKYADERIRRKVGKAGVA
jgi:large subunit ribosomal protein L6